MKKAMLFSLVVLAMMVLSCQNAGNKTETVDNATTTEQDYQSEAYIKQSIEEMMQMDLGYSTSSLLSAEMAASQEHACNVFYEGDYFFGFAWNTGLLDACGEVAEPEAKIVDVKVTDATHSMVDMRWVDEPCYDLPYTLQLVWEDGQWKIDDVVYYEEYEGMDERWNTLRGRCDAFYESMLEQYTTQPADEINAFLLSNQPEEAYYTDSDYAVSNAQYLQKEIERLKSCHELFKQNQGYTEEMGRQIDAMIAGMESHLAQ